jgi:hypothetical protein
MYSKPLYLLYAFLACLIFSQCKKEDVAGPAGPAGPDGPNGVSAITGIVHGRVILYDSLGKPLTDNSGVSVSVDPAVSILTQTDGFFTSSAMSAGTYNLSVSKTGYGTMKIYHFQNTGGVNASETGNIQVGAIQSSWFDIKTLQVDTASQNGSNYMNITITLVHPQHISPAAEIVLFLSHTPGAGNSNNELAFRSNYYQQDDSTLLYSYFDVSLAEYSDNLYNATYLYMAAAIDNPAIFNYIDESGNTVFPCIGHLSNEVKVYNNLK